MLDKNTVLSICEDVSPVIVEKLRIKYPKYFDNDIKLEVGAIYKFEGVIFQYYEEEMHLYNKNDFEYLENSKHQCWFIESNNKYWTKVTDNSIIERYLIQEAKRRGYVDGTKYKYYSHIETVGNCKNFKYNGIVGYQYLTDGCGGSVFYDGKWAEII